MKYIEYYRQLCLFDNKGSALTTVLVLASMVGFFGLAVMQTSKDQSDAQRNIHVRDAANKVTDNIRALLQHHGTCKINFQKNRAPHGPKFMSRTSRGTGKISSITNDLGSANPIHIIYKIGNKEPYQNYGYLDEITYTFEPRIDIAEVTLTFRKYKPISGLTGLWARQRERSVTRTIPVKMIFCTGNDISGHAAHSDCAGATPGDLKNCFAFFGKLDTTALTTTYEDNPLKEACENLGGEFRGGICDTVEYQSRLIKGNAGAIEPNYKSLCEQMGSTWDSGDKKCRPIFTKSDGTGIECPTGRNVVGWSSIGGVECEAP